MVLVVVLVVVRGGGTCTAQLGETTKPDTCAEGLFFWISEMLLLTCDFVLG